MMGICRHLREFRKLAISPAGVSIAEHAVVTVLMMLAYMILIRRFGLDTIGIWVLLTTLMNYANVGDIWSRGLITFMGEERGQNRPGAAASYASTAIITGIPGYLLLMSATGAALFFLSPSLFAEDQQETVRSSLHLLVLAFWLKASSDNFLQAFIGFGLPVLSAIQRITGALVLLAGVVFYPSGRGIEAIFHIQISQGATMMVYGCIIYFGYVARPVRHVLWDRTKLIPLFRFGTKLLAVNAVQSTIEPLIKFMIGHFAGLPAVAVLELALRLIQAVRGLILSIGQVVITCFARICSMHKQKESRKMAEEFHGISRIILGGSVSAFALLFTFSPLIEWVFFRAESPDASTRLFPMFLVVFGMGWMTSSMVSGGYFLLVALRQAWPLFISEAIRAGIIAFCGGLLGHFFGTGGFLLAVMLSFLISSFHLFSQAAARLSQPFLSTLRETAVISASAIPLIWAAVIGMIWILRDIPALQTDVSAPVTGTVLYLIGPVGAGVLVLKFGRLDQLSQSIRSLKP